MRASATCFKHAELQGVKVIATDGKRLDGMAPGAKHQGVVARIEGGRKVAHLDDVLDTLEEPAFLLVLDGITDPRNLGACLRVADAAGVHAVIAPKDRAVGLTDVAMKTACGAAEDGALRDGDQPGADAARAAGTRNLGDRDGRRGRERSLCGRVAEGHGLGAGCRRRGHAPPDP
jgi:hypothetical protein